MPAGDGAPVRIDRAETARRLDVSLSTVDRYADRPDVDLTAIRTPSRRVLFDAVQVERLRRQLVGLPADDSV